MSDLKMFLLGSSNLERGGMTIKIGTRKALALLIYLTVTGQRHSRDTLATLFWPENNQSQARAYLRRALWMLKTAVGDDLLIVEGQSIGVDPEADLWLDVDHFHRLLSSCENHGHGTDVVCDDCLTSLADAVDIYKGIFLAGFTLSDSPEFDEWQFFQADSLQKELALSLERLVEGYSAAADYESAIPHARRWVALDPLHEVAQRTLMQVYHQSGQSSAALRQYTQYAALLHDEMGLSPEQETTSLYEAIKTDRQLGSRAKKLKIPGKKGDENVPASHTAHSQHNLPVQPTMFIGREKELEEIGQLLRDEPGCRLLTLVGPGGIGKTRLALEAASLVGPTFGYGVYFVSLAPVAEVEFILSAIAETLKFNFQGELDPKIQLLNHLSQKNCLLVLDNFEHLLSAHGEDDAEGDIRGGEKLLTEILAAAPHLKFLVTSRELLNLQEEWSYEVPGMPYPQETSTFKVTPDNLEHYAAIQLFLQRARKADANFKYSTEDLHSVTRICRLVGGMPLGIELAAPWVRLMSCREIADEIERSFDLLATSMRNIPERHRNMRAIFEQTWRQLSAEEQAILSKFSIFRGGCLRGAAEFVTGASLHQLSSLVDKALIRRITGRRYELHELIRQFALEQLQHTPKIYTQTIKRHYRYYTKFLQQQVEGLKGGAQLEAIRLIAADIDNVRSAWQWAVEAKDSVALERAADGLYLYSELGGVLAEGESAFRQAVTAFDPEKRDITAEETSLRGYLLVGQGSLCAHRGDLLEGQTLLEQGLALLDPVNDEGLQVQKRAFALILLGWILFLQAKYAEAEQVIHESLALYTEIDDRWGVAKSLYILGNSLTGSGRLAEAEPPLRQSLAICQDIGDRHSQLLVEWNLAILTFWFGDYDQTEKFLTDAVVLGQELDDQIGMALTLKELGKLDVARGNYSKAIQIFQESITITDEIGSQWESAATLEDLSLALCLKGDYVEAENALRRCLQASRGRQHNYFVARCLGDLGLLAYYKEQYQQAVQNLQQALDIWTDLGHEPYIAWVLCKLGHALQAMSLIKYAETKEYYMQALQLSMKHRLAPFAMDVFTGIARLMIQLDEKEYAFDLLILVESHPASTAETRKSVRMTLADLDVKQLSEVEKVVNSYQVQDWQVTAVDVVDALAKSNSDQPEGR